MDQEKYPLQPYLDKLTSICIKDNLTPMFILTLTAKGEYKLIAPTIIRSFLSPEYRGILLERLENAMDDLYNTPLDDLERR